MNKINESACHVDYVKWWVFFLRCDPDAEAKCNLFVELFKRGEVFQQRFHLGSDNCYNVVDLNLIFPHL